MLFFLTFSGLIDFFVVKNDVKTKIADYQNSKFLDWLKINTTSRDIFLTNSEVYDPITLIGRQSFIGRPHYLWAYGINPEERLKIKNEFFLSGGVDKYLRAINDNGINYIVLYKSENKLNDDIYTGLISEFEVVYKDNDVVVLMVIYFA